MALWPDEYEGLRAEAREMAQMIRDTYAGAARPESAPTDLKARVAAQRAFLDPMEITSPDGRDEIVGGVPCRRFDAKGPSRGTYLHFHGGAMIVGSPRMNDVANAAVADGLGLDVVSVDYRLAPEHPFPAGSDDCLAVARALVEVDDRPLAVGGESAGGYFAALTLLRVRDELGAIDRFRAANLMFGVYDLGGTPTNRGARPSDVPDILDDDVRTFVQECYIPSLDAEEARDPAVSPLYARLHDMPPALFTVGLADHLLDDSLFLASRWQSFGNEAELAVYPDCGHAFTGFPMELAKRANERIDTFLDDAFTR
jgi:acetyl esterase/lipase